MGVASIPDREDQCVRDRWKDSKPRQTMDVRNTAKEDFVTVVSVGSQASGENFVTVLSIDSTKKENDAAKDCDANSHGRQVAAESQGESQGDSPQIDAHGEAQTKVLGSPSQELSPQLEEEVEVFRLPGERLGFGLKFEGGNKTSERVKRLFVQSCAEQSPASRAKCSWGSLGEGDEVLSIDGVPVTLMTRLDCVRRLKESQLVIKLLVRCRGALRPEVVSAERKANTEERKSQVPPELPSVPPPVPPRKLRHARGSADGEANPSPVKKVKSKAANERSPELAKTRQQEPPEAMVYLDARSQCGSAHGSASDDTGSSMSTVVDKFSACDRVSTVSTTSTVSTASMEQSQLGQRRERSPEGDASPSVVYSFEQLEEEFSCHPPDYLLRKLANSEAVTHVESRGEIERITAVVAPNTVVIEETIGLQPPLSFQDAPLSYGHEARPDLFYADSTTHFRPIKHDADEESLSSVSARSGKTPPPLPARNHVNRINVNDRTATKEDEIAPPRRESPQQVPLLPPKPLPRRDAKSRRKRPPPPPPPPPPLPPPPAPSTEEITSEEPTAESSHEESVGTNKMLEIIEIRKSRATASVSTCTFASQPENRDNPSNLRKFKRAISQSSEDSASEDSSMDGKDKSFEKESQSDSYKDALSSRKSDEDETYRSLDSFNDEDADRVAPKSVDNNFDNTSDESDEDYYWQSNLAPIGEEEETTSLEYASANKDAKELESKTNGEFQSPALSDASGKKTTDEDERDEEEEEEEQESKRNAFCGEERVEEERRYRIGAFGESHGNRGRKDLVNARMDNCGGGQRLPPDGDEFPAAYQEFDGTNGNSQYRFSAITATTTTTMTPTTNNNNNNNNSNGNNNTSTIASTLMSNVAANAASTVRNLNVVTGGADELLKMRANDKSVLLTSLEMSAESKKNGEVQHVSEKKIEIAAYYHKDGDLKREETCSDVPPPLPLTGPPKIDSPGARGRSAIAESSPRKFSSNADLWRQDDKSERSVKDKIAMFSSQSSLDGPLFPNAIIATNVANNGRRLSKYKSTEDVYNDEKLPSGKERASFFVDRTQSSFDLTDSSSIVHLSQESAAKYSPKATNSVAAKSSPPPPIPQKPNYQIISPFLTSTSSTALSPSTESYRSSACQGVSKNYASPNVFDKATVTSSLIRATSFSGSTPLNFGQERTSAGGEIARTNSFASNFKKQHEDVRRNSLNQLIEQRRRSISKLRGLVIPEREAVAIHQPIVDLPEIKSRDSILLQQMPKANIQDKWGSQSSLASNTSTASMPLPKATTFKMPAPQINSKYSPAFKRKSLTVYGSSTTNSSAYNVKSPQPSPSALASEPPKSLESICSPTRSDYSFEFVSTASSSPDVSRTKRKSNQRKIRTDYDDSDNDSAVSSSQSSISRGFSPPTSPVPSERSTVSSSERSYVSTDANSYHRRSLVAPESSNRTFLLKQSNNLHDRTYVCNSERSSEGSSTSGSDARSPQPTEIDMKNAEMPQRQIIRRSNSTETNCSTSSTLTSGSQASAESLSRRVLKPTSVEAINRKNILASARCRSGRELNGSPLIQRKFPDDDAKGGDESSSLATSIAENEGRTLTNSANNDSDVRNIKIAYIEVTDTFVDEEESSPKKSDECQLAAKRSGPPSPAARLPKSSDSKTWVRTEAQTLAARSPEKRATADKIERSGKSFSPLVEQRSGESDPTSKERCKANRTQRKRMVDEQNDLLTILATKSRSRSAIHVDDGTFARSKSQMSLEDILGQSSAKLEAPTSEKLLRTQSVGGRTENGRTAIIGEKTSTVERWREERHTNFVSKIPTASGNNRVLARRSISVTDMKKALETVEQQQQQKHQQQQQQQQTATSASTYNRFHSLDNSVGESVAAETDGERLSSEQFGSITSLASSTSLISQQELAQLVEEASLEETRGVHDVIVVLLHKENPNGSVGITLAGGADCEVKEITVHRVLAHSVADKDGRVQKGDRILSINGKSTRGLTHRESLAVLKQPRSEVVLVVSRTRPDETCKLRSRTASVETIVEGFETNDTDDTAWGPPSTVAVYKKDGAGLGFSLEGGRDSPLGDRPLLIKKIFTGGAAEKTGALRAGDQLLEVNGNDVTRMSRIEAWSLMKKLHDGEVNLLVRHPATKSS